MKENRAGIVVSRQTARAFAVVVPLFLLLLLMLPHAASGQTTLASVSGVIVDEQHNVLPGATITLKSLETGGILTTVTTTSPPGTFRLLGIPPGAYEIAVTLEGFAERRSSFSLSLGENAELPITLAVETLRTTITVSGDSALIEPSKTTGGRTLTTKDIEDLPVAGRDFTTLALLAPGVLENHSSNPVTSARFLSAGQTGRNTGFLIDGLSASSLQASTPEAAFSLDAVREFTVLTNGLPAEYGGFSGAVVNIITRSGTSTLTGRGFYYHRDDAWDATPALARITTPPPEKTTLAQKTAGGFVGGPLVPGRAFFFGSVEDTAQQTEGIITSGVLQVFEPGAPTHIPLYNNTLETLGRADVRIDPSNNLMLRQRVVRVLADPRFGQADVGKGAPERAIDGLTGTQDLALLDTQTWGSRALNEARFQWARNTNDLEPTSCLTCPDIQRPGIKLGKNSSVPNGYAETRWQVSDMLTYVQQQLFGGEHLFKIGVDASLVGLDRTGLPNHEGTFNFRTDAPFDAGNPQTYPFQYSRATGSAFSHEDAAVYAAFAHDQWRVHPRVTLNLGVRWDYEHAEGVSQNTRNIGPRLAIAFGPWEEGRLAIRSSYGRYYDQVPLSIPQAVDQARATTQIVILNPGYPDPSGSNPFLLSRPGLSTTTVLANMQTPYTDQGTMGLQRQLGTGLAATVDGVWARGHQLFVTHDLNYPDLTNPAFPRPNPNFFQILAVETRGHSWYKALQVGLEQRPLSRYGFSIAYTLSSSQRDTEDSDFKPEDQRDFAAERAPSSSDGRHRLVTSASLNLSSTVRVTGVTVVQSALPYTITTGLDINHDGVVNDRPPGLPRNSARGTPLFQTDVRLSKAFGFGSRHLDVLVEAFNVLNRSNWTAYDGVQMSPTFGRPQDAAPPRQVQVGARISF
jgi:hypothetical protein